MPENAAPKTMHTMTLRDTLLAYSEWLDGQGEIVRGADRRPFDDLAPEFIAHWESVPGTAALPRPSALGRVEAVVEKWWTEHEWATTVEDAESPTEMLLLELREALEGESR